MTRFAFSVPIAVLLTAFSMQSGLLAQAAPCQNEVFRQFDFWIGNWQVGNDTSIAGYSRVEVILDSCVLLENWTGAGASRGKSFNHYDFASQTWKQKWVDNFGTNLEFMGSVRNDSMIYMATSIGPRSRDTILNRMIIAKIDQDHVKQHWVQSNDDGKTWTVAFDAIYSRVIDAAYAMDQHLAVRETMDAMYAAISFDADHPYNRERFASNFMEEATLLNAAREGTPRTVEDFADDLAQMQAQQPSFFERDGPAEIEVFGKVAQYKGYYHASRDEAGSQTISKGVNLVQLVRTADGQWKIISIVWDQDGSRNPFLTMF